jgi:hypothetical protein
MLPRLCLLLLLLQAPETKSKSAFCMCTLLLLLLVMVLLRSPEVAPVVPVCLCCFVRAALGSSAGRSRPNTARL